MAEGQAQGQAEGQASAARVARDAAIAQAAGTLAYIAVCVAVSVAIVKRDELARAWRRLTARRPEAEASAYAVALGELRQEISRMEHGL
jgi:hypothetical protein